MDPSSSLTPPAGLIPHWSHVVAVQRLMSGGGQHDERAVLFEVSSNFRAIWK
jgi:hypothetical protein